MRLIDRIVHLDLAPEAMAALRDGLGAVAGAGFTSMEHTLLSELFDREIPEDTVPASLDELWSHGDLVIETALTIAVSDGNYGVEEARVIGSLASRLGISAGELSAIEDRVFTELAARPPARRGP
jgi:hypothetical protein